MPVTPSFRIPSEKAAITATNETGGTEKCVVTLPGKSAASQLLQSAAKATIHHAIPAGRTTGVRDKHTKRQGFLQIAISKLSCFCLAVHAQQSSDNLGCYLISIRVFEIGTCISVWSLNNCTINFLSHSEAAERIRSVNGASPSTVGEWKGSSTVPRRREGAGEGSASQQDCQELLFKGWESNLRGTLGSHSAAAFTRALVQYLLWKQVSRCHSFKKAKC